MLTINIPQEIVDLILDNFHTDLDVLHRCSYVSKSFLVSCRRHLFACVKLTSASRCERIFVTLSSRPEFVPNIRQLHVIDRSWVSNDTTYVSVLRLFADSGTLEMFHFVDRRPNMATARSFPHPSVTKELFKAARLKSVILQGVQLCSFPMDLLMPMVTSALLHLSFTGKCVGHTCNISHLHTENSPSPPPSYLLHSLVVRGDYSDFLMQYLWERLLQLRTLRIVIHHSAQPLFRSKTVDLRQLQCLRLLVIELEYTLDPLLDILVAGGIPWSLEHLVVLISPIYYYPNGSVDEKLAEIMNSSDANPRLKGIHLLVHIPTDSFGLSGPEIRMFRTRLEMDFERSRRGRRAGLFKLNIVYEKDVEAILENLNTIVCR